MCYSIRYTVCMTRRQPTERFFAKVNKEGPVHPKHGQCWIWTGAKLRNGYGFFRLHGNPQPAHRASYTLFVGSIPDNKEIDHLCENKSCVRPSHLEAVSGITNMQRLHRLTGDVKHNVFVVLRLTSEEKLELASDADSLGLSLSNFVRKALKAYKETL